MDERNDHDVLICVEVKLKELIEDFKDFRTNHLNHHFRYNLLAWSIAGMAIISLLVALIKLT